MMVCSNLTMITVIYRDLHNRWLVEHDYLNRDDLVNDLLDVPRDRKEGQTKPHAQQTTEVADERDKTDLGNVLDEDVGHMVVLEDHSCHGGIQFVHLLHGQWV